MATANAECRIERPCLVVDNEPDALQGLCKLFRQQGHSVTPAIDATIALNILEKSAGDVELVATDVCMPGMNGIELGRRISGLYSGIPVVYFSAHDREPFAQMGLHLPDYLPFFQKPFDRQLVCGLIAEVLRSKGHGSM
jgi:CheY-like chemotaxis protein